ncbi:integral membrane protein [Drechmeria coniospora]|uniref:Integral membrane protein n=1 Tax=Drechmeria coniospora TaxID=98403 RepID=A0A151GTA2_DRECN|nr:integral membrane protein [Drechmeria coniospora]KYK60335.1 integral membrane protein [Drechmeria coniospora]
MVLDRLVSMALRATELVFAAIVAGVTGHYLHQSDASSWDLSRFIYTEVVAAIAMFLSLIWLFPFSSTFIHWPMDLILVGTSCGAVFYWGDVSLRGDECGRFKADIAFAFLSALLWLVSALVGILWVRKQDRRAAARADVHHSRPWYRRSRA